MRVLKEISTHQKEINKLVHLKYLRNRAATHVRYVKKFSFGNYHNSNEYLNAIKAYRYLNEDFQALKTKLGLKSYEIRKQREYNINIYKP